MTFENKNHKERNRLSNCNQELRCMDLATALQDLADPMFSQRLASFFKKGPGEYAEHDIFLGVKASDVRAIAKKHKYLPLKETLILLKSPYHECRQLALILLVMAYRRGDASLKEKIFLSYLAHTNYINNWDLVDISASHIVGDYLMQHPLPTLIRLAQSSWLWDRRIAIVSTHCFIKKHVYDATFALVLLLRNDDHDLIQKALGWMLREIGKHGGMETLVRFLNAHAHTLPRTTLRYAIEHFPPDKKQNYMRVARVLNGN